MPRTREDELHEAIWALHDALQRRDGIEDRLRRGDVATLLYDRGLAASEAVVHARVELYRVLVSQGWTPPPSLVTRLDADQRLLHEESEHLI